MGLSPLRGALLAAAAGALVALSRIPLQGLLGAKAPFLTAWPGIMLAAFIGGFWPAIAVTVLSIPLAQWAVTNGGEPPIRPVVLPIYAAFGVVFALAGEARQRGLRKARAYAQRLTETQERLAQVGRLTAAGEMAGSLAHELNQPLTAVGNYLSAAEQILTRDGADPRAIELIQKAARQSVRAGQVVARVRANIEHGEIEAAEESLSGLVQEAVDVAWAGGLREGVAVRYEFDRGADRVLADRIQVQQVVLNLVRNAVEAMAAGPRRELCIGSRPAEPGFLNVHVADTGPGIAPEVAERLFQPFVSSKSGGMGVGLSISRNIIEAHGGKLWAGTNGEGGTTFHFTLPRPTAEKGSARP